MADYDQEEDGIGGINPFGTVDGKKGMAFHASNSEDPYMTEPVRSATSSMELRWLASLAGG